MELVKLRDKTGRYYVGHVASGYLEKKLEESKAGTIANNAARLAVSTLENYQEAAADNESLPQVAGDLSREMGFDVSYAGNADLAEGIPKSSTVDLVVLVSLTGSAPLTDLSPLARFADSEISALYLWSLGGVTDLGPLSALTSLTQLSLLGCVGVTDLSPLAALNNLYYLDLRHCEAITDLSPLAELKNLTVLDIEGCKGITDRSVLETLPNLGKSKKGSISGNSKSGCFIATACYGSADCRQVATLRAFRDVYLTGSWAGRLGLRLYARFSPPVADYIRTRPRLKGFVRKRCVDPLVRLASSRMFLGGRD